MVKKTYNTPQKFLEFRFDWKDYPWLSWDLARFPLGWTLISIIAIVGVGLPIIWSDRTSQANQIGVTVLFAIFGAYFSIASVTYLFVAIFRSDNTSNPFENRPLGNVLNVIDVWLCLLFVQTGVLFVPYMFDPMGAFSGLDQPDSVWFAFLQLFTLIATNFHGGASPGVFPEQVFPYIWLTVSALIATLYFLLAIPHIIWSIRMYYMNHKKKEKGKEEEFYHSKSVKNGYVIKNGV